jgi:hypothetical protein
VVTAAGDHPFGLFLMAYEEIEITIDKEGWVYVDTRGLAADRIRALSDHLEEVFGPKVHLITDPEEMPPQVINTDEARRLDVLQNTGSPGLEDEELEKKEDIIAEQE